MAIDLSGLDAGLDLDAAPAKVVETKTVIKEVSVSDGKPLQLPIDDVYPDPNQPRRHFDEEKLIELAQSIEIEGVRSPVSVRPHPEKAGAYMLNYGERRLKASQIAGLKTIPAFIDNTSNSYVQVIENLQRENLSAIELANFIQTRLAAKEKKGDIAKKLGVSNDIVTFHSALIDAPAFVIDAYRAGKFQSARVAYELRKAHEAHGDAIEAWASSQTEITRSDVVSIGKKMKTAENGPEEQGGALEAGAGVVASPADTAGASSGNNEAGQGEMSAEAGNDGSEETEPKVHPLAPANPDHHDNKPPQTQTDPSKIKKPILIVVHGKRSASVQLNKRPSSPGLLHIKYEDNGEEAEVDAGKCKINHLMESSIS